MTEDHMWYNQLDTFVVFYPDLGRYQAFNMQMTKKIEIQDPDTYFYFDKVILALNTIELARYGYRWKNAPLIEQVKLNLKYFLNCDALFNHILNN